MFNAFSTLFKKKQVLVVKADNTDAIARHQVRITRLTRKIKQLQEQQINLHLIRELLLEVDRREKLIQKLKGV